MVRLTEDAYVLWSNTTDAPASAVMTRDGMITALYTRCGSQQGADALLQATDESGTSDPSVAALVLIENNRAGPGESRLTRTEILTAYAPD